MSSLTLEGAGVWAEVPRMAPETERRAALAAAAFLKEVGARVQEAREAARETGKQALSDLHEIYDFSRFDPEWMPFVLAALGRGEVRIALHDGLVRIEETGVPALWRMKIGASESFVLSRVPLCVRKEALEGDETVGRIVNGGPDVFAAPAILEELRRAQSEIDWSAIPEDPVFMTELSRQPLSPGDARALLSTLGTGTIEAEITGFARSVIQRTRVRGIWHSRLFNNAGKTLLDAYVAAVIPPEVAASSEAFADTEAKCREIAEWLEADLARGAIG
ncbi:MAG: hydrogenase expression/formation protein [Sutterella sp.]|nr:hydrogenase expression/formation protein [Sutterella sp.]